MIRRLEWRANKLDGPGYLMPNCVDDLRDAITTLRELQAKVDDILSAVKRDDIGYIQSVYLGYADDGMPPITLDREVED
jgi:hypothetical protein